MFTEVFYCSVFLVWWIFCDFRSKICTHVHWYSRSCLLCFKGIKSWLWYILLRGLTQHYPISKNWWPSMFRHAQMWSGSPRKLDVTNCICIYDYRFMCHGLKHIFRGTETFVTSLLMTKFREQNHLNNEAISWHAILFEWQKLRLIFKKRWCVGFLLEYLNWIQGST
jgi:hypothetical protein